MTALRRCAALAAGAVLLLTAPGPAHAAPDPAHAAQARGTTAIDLGGRAIRSLGTQDVAIVARRPARIVAGELRLPVTKGLVAGSAYLNHGGALVLRRKVGTRRRTVTIGQLQTRLGGGRSRIVGSVGQARLTVFTIASAGNRVSLDAGIGSARLQGARVALTRRAAAIVKSRLGLRRLPVGRFGGLSVDALVGGPAVGGGGGGAPGGGPPVSGPIGDEPPLLARPAGAVDVTGATLTWHVRDSWIRYVSTERDAEAIEGATAGAAIDQSGHPCPDAPAAAAPPPLTYSYSLPVSSGWHDAASGTTALYSTGGVRFSYPAHGIDLDVKSLEVELAGAASRVIARFDGRGQTNPGDKRGVLVDLKAPSPPVAPGASTLIDATIPTGGSQSVFAGFYGAGEGFGCITVAYTVP